MKLYFRSRSKVSSHNDDDGTESKKEIRQFEPHLHDHDFCERIVINVYIT